MKRLLLILTLSVLPLALMAGPATAQEAETEEDTSASDTLPEQDENGDWFQGNADADLVIVEYADIQCPACRMYHGAVKQILSEHEDEVKYVFRHFPLRNSHPHAFKAAQAAEAAGQQGKFFDMLDLLYASQPRWSRASNAQEVFTIFSEMTRQLELDQDQFMDDLFNSESIRANVEEDLSEARERRLNSTPTFILNGEQLDLQGPGSLINTVQQRLED